MLLHWSGVGTGQLGWAFCLDLGLAIHRLVSKSLKGRRPRLFLSSVWGLQIRLQADREGLLRAAGTRRQPRRPAFRSRRNSVDTELRSLMKERGNISFGSCGAVVL